MKIRAVPHVLGHRIAEFLPDDVTFHGVAIAHGHLIAEGQDRVEFPTDATDPDATDPGATGPDATGPDATDADATVPDATDEGEENKQQ